MKRNKVSRLIAALLLTAMLLALLPAWALADDAPVIKQIKAASPDIPEESSGAYFVTPSAFAGNSITVYIGVQNNGTADATGMICLLPASDDLELYPFQFTGTAVDLPAESDVKFVPTEQLDDEGHAITVWVKETWNAATQPLKPGERGYFKLTAQYSAAISTLDKSLPFQVGYDGAEQTLLCPRTVKVATQSGGGGGGGSGYKSTPKVIVDGYQFDKDRIYAGEDVELELTIRNTSTTEAVKNLTLDFTDASGDITPASGGSNSIFIGVIEKSSSITLSIVLTVSPGSEAKSHLLDLEIGYEGTKNRADFTEKCSITVPVLQKIRVRITDPAIYGDPWAGQGVSMGISLYNLGKSTIYNCSVEVEGDGLSLEEPYFGGNIAAGGTMRADLSVISANAGEIKGKLKVTFEDVYGDSYEEYVDLTMMVNDAEDFTPVVSPGNAAPSPEGEMAGGAGFAWYWWALIAASVTGGVIALIVILRKRRRKYLEEL